jgi:hypothetical protein
MVHLRLHPPRTGAQVGAGHELISERNRMPDGGGTKCSALLEQQYWEIRKT